MELSALIVGSIGWVCVGLVIGVMIGNAQNSIKRHDYRERRRQELGKDGVSDEERPREEPRRSSSDEET